MANEAQTIVSRVESQYNRINFLLHIHLFENKLTSAFLVSYFYLGTTEKWDKKKIMSSRS